MLTIDIIRDIIEDMKPLLRFDSIEDVVIDEQWKLNGCNTYWLRACREIEIDGFTYFIDEVVFNESITISPLNGAPKPTILKFPIYAPSFFFGTRNAVNKDRVTEGNLDDSKGFDAITPFGFLLSRINETQPNDVDDPIDRNANIRLFFLEKYDLANEDTTNDNLLETVIRQLHVMADYFIAYVNDREDLFNMPEDITRRQYEAFSEVGVGNGWYLDDSLASVELEMTLPIRDTLSCDCKDQIDIKCAPAILYINGAEFKEIEAGKVDRIEVINTDGDQTGFKKSDTVWEVPSATSTEIVYQPPIAPNETTSYNIYDAAWRKQQGDFDYPAQNGNITRLVDFFTLADNNIFGNTDRLTDPVGGQDYATYRVLVDNYTGLMWILNEYGKRNWQNALNLTNVNAFGYDDWRLPTFREFAQITYRTQARGLEYEPFITYYPFMFLTGDIRESAFWTCETSINNTMWKSVFVMNGQPFSSLIDYLYGVAEMNDTRRVILVRRHLI